MQDRIFAKDLDETTLQQFDDCRNLPWVMDAALMPDAHAGYVAPIGSVLITKDKLVPAWVGFDIGCGVTAVKLEITLDQVEAKKQAIFDEISKTIPMGMGRLNFAGNVTKKSRTELKDLVQKFEKEPHNEDLFRMIKNKGQSNVGSLGEGNHFIELGTSDGTDVWIVIHSGSRGIGHKVATHYMKAAANGAEKYEATHAIEVDSDLGKEYLAALNFCLEFALLNRLEMARTAIECIEVILNEPINFEVWTNQNHNHAVFETHNNEVVFVHRKGATPSKKGDRGVIPGSMRDGSYLVEGLGNDDFLQSSSHGAGRKLSRRAAKETISVEDFKTSMVGVLGKVGEDTLDEAPDAYKDIVDVMEAQKESAKIIKHIRPIINWKGTKKDRK